MPVGGRPGNAADSRLVQNQQQEHVVGYLPFALDSRGAGGPESEARIKVWVANNDDEWATGVLELPVFRFDQPAADTLALAVREHGHRTESRPKNLTTDGYWTI